MQTAGAVSRQTVIVDIIIFVVFMPVRLLAASRGTLKELLSKENLIISYR
jgi:hypothetical protein